MIGFPYTYGDDLSIDQARENTKLFLKNHGSTIIINSVLFIVTKQVNAEDACPVPTVPDAPKPGVVANAPKPAAPPVFKSLLPPTGVINSPMWGGAGIISISWLCITAAVTQNPALLFACGSLVTYATNK